ncbi:hypothetical protein SERLA73DRAFT_177792 [Serpula lacrymans var. lacrymans S7.3]|uniref:Aminoglycoside phosphotransferase domain-containing protein n=2 Tax=Serpula lacrymans var. lacrymans TaxID=341189 RepID=F8PPK9_SERL3|nr:uncharacterized protein SERLADRAFT_461580 [Serpula lacrymans var. lacrymans S7.9]EGO02067.1 hypothetical protein SERLA73DRAFT_177792 [Serpula lacrymans var. lacrymans S7.3]EGO27689.1 hypothetical protein SERLADRAFT_461580 [Serpula lacrymans var. lacrymans S7.9]
MKVCIKLTELLLSMFNLRGSLICTDLQGTDINTRSASALPQDQQPRRQYQPSVLLSRPFNDHPLDKISPQTGLSTAADYLASLGYRAERIFSSSEFNQVARDTGYPENPPLSDEDVVLIIETFKRYRSLIPYHTGGFYIPGTLSAPARELAYSVLQSRHFGIYHGDMQMSRFIVRFTEIVDSPDMEVTMTLTGWEHAFRAPLWSCARMPPWLNNRFINDEPVTWERQQELRRLIYFLMNDPRILHHPVHPSWEWVVAYTYGVPERWFEGCLSSHWMFRNSLEVLLVRLKTYWESWRPDIQFPLPVGVDYRPPTEASVLPPAPGGEELNSNDSLFDETDKALLEAEAKANE